MADKIIQASNSMIAKHGSNKMTLDSCKKAADRIKPFVHHTPMLTSTYLNELSGKKLFFKCENFQKTGSFKIRGALNAIVRLQEERGNDFKVVTHSSGNFAQAISYASKVKNIEGKVVMPANAPVSKKKAVIGYGGTVIECESNAAARYAMCSKVLNEDLENSEYVPSGDHPFIMEGQGTIGLEMMADNEDLDAVIAPCSSGGLLGGVSFACKQIKPSIKAFGCEPEEADDLAQSFQNGQRTELKTYPNTIADGLRMSVGVHTWPVIKENVESVILVTDEEIVRAMYLLWERLKVIVEPSGAVPFAAVLSDQFKKQSEGLEKIGVVLSGGNPDLHDIPWMSHPDKFDV